MDSRYEPEGVEERWQRTWEEEGHYNADPDPSRKSFAIAHPPPNVTGDLHLGHALQLSLADTIVRTRRMQGYNTLFQPGFDHAGISTQNAVEKHLAQQGKSRQELGREAFVALVWDWLREYGGKIMFQFRRVGASLDYRRERFTMDDAYIRAVMHFFVHLYRKGWIYRANRIINWCPFHRTSLSDLELEHVEMDDVLSYVRYPFADGDGYITIATVRPATILADVAVAVHPDDERYRHLVGREVIVPLVERRVPIIADKRVEQDFGTGALKVTPGHDPLDYEIGIDHDLPELTVIAPDGRMNEEAGELAGLRQEEADERMIEWLRDHGQLEQQEPYRHSIARCSRCHSRIEPRISLQWWCAMDELKKPALEALRGGRVRYHPESQHRFAVQSLKEAPDWNISRQIWWGHQLPVWLCLNDGHITVEETEPAACAECGSRELTRSTDVLDTWFSSALWPFATLGWPDDTEDLRTFYPGDLNTTARDIIRLWENRMIFAGLELMGDVPFRDVVIHSLVHAPTGGRMSKSLGTGMDPIAVIDAYGADAMRYGLMKMASSQDVRFSEGAIEEGRKLANKLWNVARLIISASEGAAPEERPRSLEEHWILARLSQTQREVERLLGEFDFSHLVAELYHLTFDDFCDWYAEAVKGRLYDGDDDARATATAALERLLKLLHPAMPHVTEEIWTNLPDRQTRLIVAPWPEAGDDAEAGALQRVQEAAEMFRRSGVRVPLVGEELRIFEAVVRPDKRGGDGNAAAEIERLEQEIRRAEGMLANDRFLEKAPADVVEAEREKLARYRRELDALTP
jgi:valyl-tRNA synthetase